MSISGCQVQGNSGLRSGRDRRSEDLRVTRRGSLQKIGDTVSLRHKTTQRKPPSTAFLSVGIQCFPKREWRCRSRKKRPQSQTVCPVVSCVFGFPNKPLDVACREGQDFDDDVFLTRGDRIVPQKMTTRSVGGHRRCLKQNSNLETVSGHTRTRDATLLKFVCFGHTTDPRQPRRVRRPTAGHAEAW